MKITFPHMGNLAIPLHTIFSKLNFEVVLPPKTTEITKKLGSQHAPPQICLPFKINLGNLIEAFYQGANTMVMIGGCGPCRFGYYGSLLHQILIEMGINYKLIYLDEEVFKTIKALKKNNNLTWLMIYKAIYFGWKKLILLEFLEERSCLIRPKLKNKEEQLILEKQLDKIINSIALTVNNRELENIYHQLPQKKTENESLDLKIVIVGDIYTILESASNYNLVQELGRRGVTVIKSIKVSDWLKTSLIGFERSSTGNRLLKEARPYLKSVIGGHGLHSIGNSIHYAGQAEGIIQVMPFNCTPEIVAASILPTISTNHKIPILTLSFDEHTSNVAITTRIEAFIDLLERKKNKSCLI